MKGNQKLSLNFPLESIPENYLDTQLEEKKTWMPEGNQKKNQTLMIATISSLGPLEYFNKTFV